MLAAYTTDGPRASSKSRHLIASGALEDAVFSLREMVEAVEISGDPEVTIGIATPFVNLSKALEHIARRTYPQEGFDRRVYTMRMAMSKLKVAAERHLYGDKEREESSEENLEAITPND